MFLFDDDKGTMSLATYLGVSPINAEILRVASDIVRVATTEAQQRYINAKTRGVDTLTGVCEFWYEGAPLWMKNMESALKQTLVEIVADCDVDIQLEEYKNEYNDGSRLVLKVRIQRSSTC